MIFTNYEMGEGYVKLWNDKTAVYAPLSNVIFVEDESGTTTIKYVGARCNIGMYNGTIE